MRCMISLVAVDRAIYSASVDDSAISVWSFDDQTRGHPANMIQTWRMTEADVKSS